MVDYLVKDAGEPCSQVVVMVDYLVKDAGEPCSQVVVMVDYLVKDAGEPCSQVVVMVDVVVVLPMLVVLSFEVFLILILDTKHSLFIRQNIN